MKYVVYATPNGYDHAVMVYRGSNHNLVISYVEGYTRAGIYVSVEEMAG